MSQNLAYDSIKKVFRPHEEEISIKPYCECPRNNPKDMETK
jgi:hypothetical protein